MLFVYKIMTYAGLAAQLSRRIFLTVVMDIQVFLCTFISLPLTAILSEPASAGGLFLLKG